MRMMWTEERDSQLRFLWAKGDTASQIGIAMDLTRNAVLGRVHRIGLPGRVVDRINKSVSLDSFLALRKSSTLTQMATQLGISRSSVQDLAKHFHLPPKLAPKKESAAFNPPKRTGFSMARKGRSSKTQKQPPTIPAETTPIAGIEPLPLLLRDIPVRRCAYAVCRDPEDQEWLFCSAPTSARRDGSRTDYCGFHFSLMYRRAA